MVIAIIAILASLLLPALARGKALARRTVCQNNLRQLALAMRLYASDHGRYPPGMYFSRWPRGGSMFISFWNGLLLPYVATNLNVFWCPAFPPAFRWDRESPMERQPPFPRNITGNRPFCYALNRSGLVLLDTPLGLDAGWLIGRKPSEIAVPSDMIAIGDNSARTERAASKTGLWGVFSGIGAHFRRSREESAVGEIHSRGGNMVFLDGHAEWGRPSKWLAPNQTAARRWNFDHEPHEEIWRRGPL